MCKENKNILVYIAASWGELHWLLPVLSAYKQEYQRAQIHLFFNIDNKVDITGKDEFYATLIDLIADSKYDLRDLLSPLERRIFRVFDIKLGNDGIFARMARYVRKRIMGWYYELKNARFAIKLLELTNPDIFIRDIGNDYGFKSVLINKIRSRKLPVIVAPHGTDFYIDRDKNDLPRRVDADVVMCISEDMIDYYKTIGNKPAYVAVGTPRYDQWWIEYVQSEWIKKGQTLSWQEKSGNNVLLMTRCPSPHYLSKTNYEYLINTSMTEILKRENNFVVVRPHPREDLGRLTRILSKFDRNRWVIETTDLICFVTGIKYVVSMWTSTILDALSVNLPVIEYFRFEGTNLQWTKGLDGKPTTIYRKLGLVIPANTADELSGAINALEADRSASNKRFMAAYREKVPETYDGSTRKVMDVLRSQFSSSLTDKFPVGPH